MKIKITQATLDRFRDAAAACRQRRCASCGARTAPSSVHGATPLCQKCRDAADAHAFRLRQAERLIAEYRRTQKRGRA